MLFKSNFLIVKTLICVLEIKKNVSYFAELNKYFKFAPVKPI